MDALIRPPTDGAAALANELSGLGQEEEEDYDDDDDDDDGEGAGTVNVHDYMYDWSCMPTNIPSTYLPDLPFARSARADRITAVLDPLEQLRQCNTIPYITSLTCSY